MSEENTHTPGPADETPRYYEETIVEYVDNRRQRTILAAILVLIILLIAVVGAFVLRMSQPAGAPKKSVLPKGVTWIRSLYAWGKSPSQMMVGPTNTAIGPDGTIWVVTNKRDIIGFQPTGQVRRVILLPLGVAPGQAISLEGIGVGGDGSIYVADYGKNAIMVFSPSGRFLREWSVQLPNEVAVRGDRVAVAAAYGIGIFDTQGNLVSKWGGRGTAIDQVDLPQGIVIGRDGNIYVADTQNKRITAFAPNGRILWQVQSKNTPGMMSVTETLTIGGVPQEMQLPAGMTQDAAGRLLLVDPFDFQVLVVDPSKKGLIVARYGHYGTDDGEFGYPTGISYDPRRDQMAIADTANNRVQIIRLPDTGGNAISRGLAWLSDRPVWLCFIPLLLLLLAIVLWVRDRAARREAESASSTHSPHDGQSGPQPAR